MVWLSLMGSKPCSALNFACKRVLPGFKPGVNQCFFFYYFIVKVLSQLLPIHHPFRISGNSFVVFSLLVTTS